MLDAARFLIENAFRDPARRKAAARKSCAEDQVRTHSARALWRHRNHLALELSVFDSGDGDHGGAGCGKCRGAQAFGVDAADCARTAVAAARGRSSRRHFPGAARAKARPARRWCRSEIDKLVFTGSVATGRRIAQIAAERLLPVVLELGGKDPMLVLEDADVDVASSGAVWGAFVNAGQTCLSVERCYVHQSLYPAFSMRAPRRRASCASAMAWMRRPKLAP